ncbi:universal stress protein [Deinococcus navajonensis]|uniref:Universal stress protein n=1 Tax=Deinococcus navajonensis TaxID=309884 RepID=A0ABV8XKT3_9DEIO
MTDDSLAPALSYQRLLVATGGAPHSQRAVERAAQLALHFGAVLHIVTVVPQAGSALRNAAAAFPGGETFEVQARQDDFAQRQTYQQQLVNGLRARGVTVEPHLVQALKPADAILAVAREQSAELIVLGRKHTSAWSAALAGSVSDMVSHAAGVDVLIVR